jgi:fatty-acid desaturase
MVRFGFLTMHELNLSKLADLPLNSFWGKRFRLSLMEVSVLSTWYLICLYNTELMLHDLFYHRAIFIHKKQPWVLSVCERIAGSGTKN